MSGSNWFLSCGVGASIGAVVVAAVQAFAGRSESRAKAADLIADAAGGLTDRLASLNAKLDADNERLRLSVQALSDAVGLLLRNADFPEEVAEEARSALLKATNGL